VAPVSPIPELLEVTSSTVPVALLSVVMADSPLDPGSVVSPSELALELALGAVVDWLALLASAAVFTPASWSSVAGSVDASDGSPSEREPPSLPETVVLASLDVADSCVVKLAPFWLFTSFALASATDPSGVSVTVASSPHELDSTATHAANVAVLVN
jgi:hypothetical protein